MPYTAGDLAKVFLAMEKDEPIFIAYLTKEDVVEKLEGFDLDDEEENPIDPSSLVTNDFAEKVFSGIGDNDYLWERFNETFTDLVYDLAKEEKEETTGEQLEEELWDTETEKTNVSA